MWLRHDRLMIVLRPSATRHKFWLCTGFATGRPPEHPPGRPLRYRIQAMEMSADRKKNTQPAVLCVGADLLTSQTAFGGQLPYKGSLVRPVARFGHTYSCMMVGFYEPRTTIFSRAEGYSRRCIQFEFVAAKRHLSPRRPATGGAVGSKIKKFKFFCFFRRNLHPRVEYYTYKGRDHKE